jgi:hypothetical protein
MLDRLYPVIVTVLVGITILNTVAEWLNLTAHSTYDSTMKFTSASLSLWATMGVASAHSLTQYPRSA